MANQRTLNFEEKTYEYEVYKSRYFDYEYHNELIGVISTSSKSKRLATEQARSQYKMGGLNLRFKRCVTTKYIIPYKEVKELARQGKIGNISIEESEE